MMPVVSAHAPQNASHESIAAPYQEEIAPRLSTAFLVARFSPQRCQSEG
jgi:hypothetical protein